MANRSSCRWPRIRFASVLLLSMLAADLSAAGVDAPQVLADPAFDAIAASLGGEALYLEVSLNGAPTGRILHFMHANGRFHAGSAGLRQLGLDVAADARAVDLASLDGVSWTYDPERQRIDLAVPGLLDTQARTRLNSTGSTVPQPQATPGALLNYDLYATADRAGARSVSAFAELRTFGRHGVFSTSWLGRGLDAPHAAPATESRRLDTSWTHSFVDSASVLRVGDSVTGALAWTRATRLGGIQWRRDFALQPELVTFPVPAFLGQATLPSTVELYVDGLRQYGSETPAGPFQLDAMPIVNGAGDAQVVVTDALGRQQTYDFAFYTSNQLLRAGLDDWSLDLGFVREDYGLRSFGYAAHPSASATWRHGATDRLTVEAHAEATDGLAAAGAGAVVRLGGAGTLSASYASSAHAGRRGDQAALGYAWRNRWFNFAIDTQRGDGYADIASLQGTSPPKRSDRVLAGFTTPRLGGFGANYVQLAWPDQPRSRYASAFWFRSFGARFALSASLNQNLDDAEDRSAFVSLSLNLGTRTNAGLGLQHDARGNAATLDLARSIPSDGGLGWRARMHDGEQASGQAELAWRAQATEGVAGVQHQPGNTSAHAGVGGAWVLMDQHFYATRRIDQAFAVVATGLPGVPVLLSNREVGRTDANGNLLVTPLNAFQRNLLSIDPLGLSADLGVERVESDVVPADRSGTLVDFRVQPVFAASLILQDEHGNALPVGSVIERNGEAIAVVGYDGAAYLEGLAPDNEVIVRHGGGQCRVRFRYEPAAGGVPLLGPLRCAKE